MPDRDIVVVGTSAVGVAALVELARGLPPGLPAALFVVCHFPPGSTSVLPDILSRSGPLMPINFGCWWNPPASSTCLPAAGRSRSKPFAWDAKPTR